MSKQLKFGDRVIFCSRIGGPKVRAIVFEAHYINGYVSIGREVGGQLDVQAEELTPDPQSAEAERDELLEALKEMTEFVGNVFQEHGDDPCDFDKDEVLCSSTCSEHGCVWAKISRARIALSRIQARGVDVKV